MPSTLNLKQTQEIKISPSIVIFTVFFLIFLYFLYYIQSTIILLFLAFIMMVALNPAVSKMEKRLKLPRVVSMFLVYVLTFFSIAGLIALIIPPLAVEIFELVKATDMPWIQDYAKEFSFTLTELSSLAGTLGESVTLVITIVSSTFSSVFTVFTLSVMSFYLMIDRKHLHKKISWITKDKEHIKLAKDFIDSLESQLQGWVHGQVVLMSVIGLITYIGLILLSIPFALPLALMAAMLEILPNLGPTIAAVPAAIIAFLYAGPLMCVVVILFYVVVQQLENNLIVPRIMKKNADVNPLVSILSILIGFEVYGVIGAVIAIPAYIVLRTMYSLWWQHKS